MDTSDIKKTIQVKIKNAGIKGFLKEAICHALCLVVDYKRYILLTRDTSLPIPEIKAYCEISIRTIGFFDVITLQKILTPKMLEQFSRFIAEGKVCLASFEKDNIVNYSWISFKNKGFVKLGDKEAYLFDSFTVARYRNMGIHTSATAERLRIIKSKGCRYAVILVSPRNKSALKVLDRLGFKKNGEAHSLSIPLFKLIFSSVKRMLPGGRVQRYRSLVCNYKRLNLYMLTIQEVILSCFRRGYENFYDKWKVIPKRELEYLSQHCYLDMIEKVIVIGGGAIPYTAIFYATQLNKPVHIIEKSAFAVFFCRNLLKRFNPGYTIKIIKGVGVTDIWRNNTANKLFIICLHVTQKQKIFEQTLSSNGNNIILVRRPSRESSHLYDKVRTNGLRSLTIEHNSTLSSMVFCKGHSGNGVFKDA